MRKALYRKYRPRRFSDVLGQGPICETLRNQLTAGKVGHAYIFTGIRGTGKTTLAKILAKAVNCHNVVDGEPCGVCDICRGIDSGALTDVTEIDAASNNGVDNIRDLRDESAYTPVVCDKRVYIIDEVHMLSSGAWAALLKIMEEPPEHVMFILATTEIQKVPATILSRCQRFDLHRITAEDLMANVKAVAAKEDIDIEPEAAATIARLADGAMRDALSLLETCASAGGRVTAETVRLLTGMVDRSYLGDLAASFADGDVAAALELVDRLYKESMDPARLASELIKQLRNILMAKLSADSALGEYSDEEKQEFRDLAARFERAEILRLIALFGKLYDTLPASPDRRLALELSVMQACSGAVVETAEVPVAVPQKPIPKRPVAEKPKAPAAEDDLPPWEVEAVPEGREEPAPVPEEELPPILHKAPAETKAPAGYKPVANWNVVIETMRGINGLFYGFLLGTKAYTTDTHLLIEGSEIFFKYMRENAPDRDTLKAVIAEKLGISLPIGPYKPKAQGSAPVADKGLEEFLDLAHKGGIPIEYV